MSQKFQVNVGSNESSKVPHIKPKLAAALASLEVQLDRELARYRRTRFSERKPNQSHFWNSAHNNPIELGSTATQLNQTPLPDSENTPIEELTIQSQGSLEELNTTRAGSPLPEVNPQPSNSSGEERQKPENDHVTEKQNSKGLNSETSLNLGSIVSAQSPPKQKQAKDFPEQQTIIQSPEDYLESSEELLRSFSAEQKSSKRPEGKQDGFLTPLGIASMLLLLVACIMVGWVAANPGELPKLSFGRLFEEDSNSSAEDPKVTDGNNRSLAQPKITSIPKEPNLAAKEFPEVKNPDDVVNLKPKPKPEPTASAEPLSSPTSQFPVPDNSPQGPGDTTSNTTVETPPAIEEKQQTEPDADIKPSADGFYHVVLENQGEDSVTQAQKVVPDAYISENGKLIHLGALKTKERAQKLVSELKAKGVNAKIQ